jgi:hypothetical protein
MQETFSLDNREYKQNQDFSLSYRELLVVIRDFNEKNTLPTKNEIIEKKFGSGYVEKKWVKKKITDMIKVLKKMGFIKTIPVFNEEGKYLRNTYKYTEKE